MLNCCLQTRGLSSSADQSCPHKGGGSRNPAGSACSSPDSLIPGHSHKGKKSQQEFKSQITQLYPLMHSSVGFQYEGSCKRGSYTEEVEGEENKAEIIQNLLSKKVLNGSQNHLLLLNIIYFLLIFILRAGEESFSLEFFISGPYPHSQLLKTCTSFCTAVVVYPL